MNTNAKYRKTTLFVVLGWDYIGVAHVEKCFGSLLDAESYCKNQNDDWNYTVEQSTYLQEILPF